MSISNYTELQAEAAKWMARSDTDTTDRISDFIKMGESYLNRELRAKEMIATATITLSTSNKYIDLPNGFLEVIAFNNDFGEELKEVDYNELESYSYQAGTARPELYAIGSRIDFERTPDQAHNFVMTYWEKLDIETDATNGVLTNYPDIYLHSCLAQGFTFTRDKEEAYFHGQATKDAVKSLNKRASRNLRQMRTEIAGVSGFNIVKGR